MKKILIVENDPLIAAAMKDTLQSAGYTISAICRSGMDAITAIKAVLPDVVLMDISLDGAIDGISTAKMIKKEYEIPIIFITQFDDPQIFDNAKETLPHNYLTKPYRNDDLLRFVALALHAPIQQNQADSIYSKVEDGIFIYTKEGEYEKLLYDEILYIEASGSSTILHYKRNGSKKNEQYIVSISSNHVIKKLNYSKVFKVNRSEYVNIDKIVKINSSHVFIGNHAIKISEEYKHDIFNNRLIKIKK